MINVKTIKNVDENTWNLFKGLAGMNGLNMGKMFEKMVYEYNEKNKTIWNEILDNEKIITDKEAKIILNSSKKMRKEWGFR